MPRSGSSFRRLTTDEARRALYIDFEGEKDKPPVLLGVHRRGGGASPFVHWDVLDPTFAPLEGTWLPLRDAILKVVQRTEHRDRRIISWSQHDLNVVIAALQDDPVLRVRFERRYGNARTLAERWRNRCHGGAKPASARLADYLELIGYNVPEQAAPGRVGETIRQLRPRLAKGLTPTAAQRRRWDELKEHNRHDCAGMRRVCLIAAAELEDC